MAKVRNENGRSNSKKANEDVSTSGKRLRSKSASETSKGTSTSKPPSKAQSKASMNTSLNATPKQTTAAPSKAISKPTTTKHKATNKDTATKNAPKTVDADADSGISSPEHKSRTTSSDKKRSKISNISTKSKQAISKSRKLTTSRKVKKMTDINWVAGLIQGSTVQIGAKKTLTTMRNGIGIHTAGNFRLRKTDGVDYLTSYGRKTSGTSSGFVRMLPGRKKRRVQSIATINFTVLIGKVTLQSATTETDYKSGSLITIPKGVRYGLANPTKGNAFLYFHTLT